MFPQVVIGQRVDDSVCRLLLACPENRLDPSRATAFGARSQPPRRNLMLMLNTTSVTQEASAFHLPSGYSEFILAAS